MKNILDYRRTSLEFRRLSSNMLNTNYTEGNLHLIRFRQYIDENPLISEIISNKIRDIQYDYKKSFINNDDYWCSLNIPVNNSEHIKAMYDYLLDITLEEIDLCGIARRFIHSSDSWNDIIKGYLEKVFKPLVDFIVDSLSMEMMILEPEKKETYIHQSIANNYGTANIAQRDICSINNTNLTDVKEIINLISEIKKSLNSYVIDQEIKDEVMDDLDTIQEQVESKQPKYVKLKKACQGIKNFIGFLPNTIGQVALIVTNLNCLTEKIHKFTELIK